MLVIGLLLAAALLAFFVLLLQKHDNLAKNSLAPKEGITHTVQEIPPRYRITGEAYLIAPDGFQDRQRNIPILLLRERVERPVLERNFSLMADDWQRKADEYGHLADTARERDRQIELRVPGIKPGFDRFYEDSKRKALSQVHAIQDEMRALPPESDVGEAYMTIAHFTETGSLPLFEPTAEAAVERRTLTDLQGNFVFDNVPQGMFQIYAEGKSSTLITHWLVLVYANKDSSVYLTNSNVIRKIERRPADEAR